MGIGIGSCEEGFRKDFDGKCVPMKRYVLCASAEGGGCRDITTTDNLSGACYEADENASMRTSASFPGQYPMHVMDRELGRVVYTGLVSQHWRNRIATLNAEISKLRGKVRQYETFRDEALLREGHVK